MRQNIVREQSFTFAIRVVRLCQWLRREKREYLMSRQLLRSGTAIGALVREGEYAESRADFIHKISIALKEANETSYWIELLYETKYIGPAAFESLIADLAQLLKLLTSSINTARSRTAG